MAELVPVPLPRLLARAFLEYERERKIFDLPETKFFRGLPGLDTSVCVNGRRAATPLGPAAGPHTQLAQNIVLAWLGGARILELKTVQVLDELTIPRPCIDAANVGYNVEWSQELKLEQSLREYVGAAMFLEILKASRLLGEDFPGPWGGTVFDMSVGYNLEGIRSPRVRNWIESMKDASVIIDELRAQLTGRWARYRDLPFPTRISDTVTLSTFHGCPAREIEGIVGFLAAEMDVDVCVKLNPTLLGKREVSHLLHDVLGYHEIQLHDPAFEKDLQFADALDLIPRLDTLARARGRRLSLKFSNTLVVKNHRGRFSDELMYMSGPPLHVLTMNLVKKFREHMGAAVPLSFSAGLDAQNMANVVAMNFVPVTTCTDLLRPGGYGRLVRYLERLGAKMNELGVKRIPDFVMRYRGQAGAAIDRVLPSPLLQAWLNTPGTPLNSVADPGLEQKLVDAAGLLNTAPLVEEATRDPRYGSERNKGVPRKIGSKLWLYDCINCDKCVPLCPNDANFVYETPAGGIAYDNFELAPEGARRIPGGVLPPRKAHQIANYADACNDCGNCDVFCPEDGGPNVEKPRFFGSLETYRKYAGRGGFYVEGKTLYATLGGKSYTLRLDSAADRAWFDDVEIRLSTGDVLGWDRSRVTQRLEMRPYIELKLLLEAITDPRHIHFANVAAVEEVV